MRDDTNWGIVSHEGYGQLFMMVNEGHKQWEMIPNEGLYPYDGL